MVGKSKKARRDSASQRVGIQMDTGQAMTAIEVYQRSTETSAGIGSLMNGEKLQNPHIAEGRRECTSQIVFG